VAATSPQCLENQLQGIPLHFEDGTQAERLEETVETLEAFYSGFGATVWYIGCF
jgi:hypothetical protein